jgi:YegS/Rv2252/BmrU family lipid kinase
MSRASEAPERLMPNLEREPPSRLCLIVNPTAGQSRPGGAMPQLQECLSAWSPHLEVRETDSRGAAERIAKDIRPGEFDLIIAVGGDGTINEILNGLGDHTPLGIIPLGTANVLARELGIPVNDLPAACEVLRTGEPRPIDLGWCNGRRFCLMAGIGFDAEAVKEVPPSIKDLIGAPAYVLSGLRVLNEMHRAIRYRITMPEGRIVSRGMMLVVANAASYAGPIQMAPLASLEDNLLHLCLFRERSKLAFLGQLFNVLMRRQLQDPNFVYVQSTQFRVVCNPVASIQLDGDYFGRTPAEIRCLPGAVRIVCPSDHHPNKG